MNNRWKRLAAVGAGLTVLLGAGSLSVSAADGIVAEKSYTLIIEGDSGTILPDPDMPAFWEYPTLAAGQTRTGTLRFTNEDKSAVDMWLQEIELPYDDPEALAYLGALRLRFSRNGTVVYDGPYSRVMDGDGPGLAADEVPRSGVCTYEVQLSCAFDYAGEPVPVYLDWNFMASPSAVRDPLPAPKQATWVLVLLCVTGVLVVICAVAGALDLTRRRIERPDRTK